MSQAQRDWYRKPDNRQKTLDAAKRRRARLLGLVARYKQWCGCLLCGEREPAALDLHHRDPSQKHSEVSRLVGNGSLAALRREIRQCDVLCANCHRKRHAGLV